MSTVRSAQFAEAYLAWLFARDRHKYDKAERFIELRSKAPCFVRFAGRLRVSWALLRAPWLRTSDPDSPRSVAR